MSNPKVVVKIADRTKGGSLYTATVQRIRAALRWRGFVLLPSDTCYSIAGLASNKDVFDRINTLLGREKMPISLAFPDFWEVERWVELNAVSAILLEKFTPGPITIVCNANPKLPVAFTNQTIGSAKRTIGVRIPDSVVERQAASCTQYPITTAAVRDPKDGKIVQNFEQAIEIVGMGIDKLGDLDWVAVEGEGFFSQHSTVVQVADGVERLRLIREGDIPFEEIKAVSSILPAWSYEDWT